MALPFPGDIEGLVKQGYVGGSLELVPPVCGHLELHPVAVLQRELAALVLVSKRHLETTVVSKHGIFRILKLHCVTLGITIFCYAT